MIDICDFAVGLSRQLDGRTMPSERPGHRLMETWHPLGVVGVISAFNFPAAVWSWNAALALVCGDTVVWKPSEKTALVAVATTALAARAARNVGAPENLNVLVLTDAAGAQPLVDSPLVPLISATGSERMGAAIGPRVAARFGRSILELGGNNAAVVTPSADLDLAVRGIVFAAAGTAGQRCTTMRRLIVHESIADQLASVYRGLAVGNPFEESTLVGPLIDEQSFSAMQSALTQAAADGGTVVVGGERVETSSGNGYHVRPAVVRMPAQSEVVRVRRSPRSSTSSPTRHSTRRSHSTIPCHRDSHPASSPPISARQSDSWPPKAPAAASSTSTSAPPERKSAARSAARNPPAAAASPARMLGAVTCGEPPTPSTTPPNCLLPRASHSHDKGRCRTA